MAPESGRAGTHKAVCCRLHIQAFGTTNNPQETETPVQTRNSAQGSTTAVLL